MIIWALVCGTSFYFDIVIDSPSQNGPAGPEARAGGAGTAGHIKHNWINENQQENFPGNFPPLW